MFMKNTVSIKENHEFKRIYYKGKSVCTPVVVLYYRKNNLTFNRLGLTATKKIGTAVCRNRARRVLRQAYRELEPFLKTGYDFILVARTKTPFVKTQAVKQALEECFAGREMLK